MAAGGAGGALSRRTEGQGQFRWHEKVELTHLWAQDRCLEKAGLVGVEGGRCLRQANLTRLQSLEE